MNHMTDEALFETHLKKAVQSLVGQFCDEGEKIDADIIWSELAVEFAEQIITQAQEYLDFDELVEGAQS